MKIVLIALLSFLTLNLNAQESPDPEQTVIGLFIATDQREWEKVAQCFNDLVVLDYSSMNGNPPSKLQPEQIVSAWQGILPGSEHTHHQLGNFISNVDGSEAKVYCYGTASHYLNDEQGNLWTVVGSYDFELIQQEDKSWKITSMKFNFKYEDGNASLPEKAIAQLKER